MLKNFCAGRVILSQAISVQFSVKMCVAAQNREKFTKTPHFRSSSSFKAIDVDNHKKLVISVCYV